jgi:hypothetical protein
MKQPPESISRRRFLELLPKAVVTSLAAKYASDLISHPKSLPKSSAHRQVVGESQEPPTSIIDPEMDRLLTEYINSHQPEVNKKTTSLEKKELNENHELERLRGVQALKEEISVPFDQINPEIATLYQRGFILDFASLPEVAEARNNPNIEESIKKIISLLSVESREMIESASISLEFFNLPEVIELQKKLDAIYYLRSRHLDYTDGDTKIVSYKNYVELWNKFFPGKVLPSPEVLEDLSFRYQRKMNMLYYKFFSEHYSPKIENIKNWDNQASCNLYASAFFACLVGQQHFSHRVDSQNNPIIYLLNRQTGRTEFFIEGKDGQLVKPVGSVRELSAKGQHDWMIEHGEQHGWLDVTNLDYDQKLQKLKEGYVFFGSTEDHNWVIVGLTVNGEFQPFLTQATSHNLLGVFKRVEDISEDSDSGAFYSRNSVYSAGYKLMPQLFGNDEARIFAIKPKN